MNQRVQILAPRLVHAGRLARTGIVVVVPARNEEDRIEACLASLAAQTGIGGLAVSLCVNNSHDSTARRAVDAARRLGLALLLREVAFETGGVGRARRIGHAEAMRRCPGARVLLSTDADCLAAPDWAARMAQTLAYAPVVLGGIEGIAEEAEALPRSYHAWSEIEDLYLAQAMAFETLLDPDGERGIGLNTAGGANLGFRRDSYRALGGFRCLTAGEDRDIVDRALAAGLRPVRAPDAIVRASMRSEGRAPAGMAERIAVRLARADAPLDAALMPLDAMIARHLGLPMPDGPLLVSRDGARRDLAALRRCVEGLRRLPDAPSRRAFLRCVAEARSRQAAGRPARP